MTTEQIVFEIDVTQRIAVTLDISKFTPEFVAEFNSHFFDFGDPEPDGGIGPMLKQHAEHIAQMQARGVIDLEVTGEFIEGYGPSNEMGISAKPVWTETDWIGHAPAEALEPIR